MHAGITPVIGTVAHVWLPVHTEEAVKFGCCVFADARGTPLGYLCISGVGVGAALSGAASSFIAHDALTLW
jgi:hypothetical protein